MRLLLAAILVAAGCAEAPARTGRVRVVATTGMVADLARVVGGDRVDVTALMGPGVDPHLYKATQGDLGRLRAADLVLYNGRLLEGRMTDVLVKLARDRPVVAVTEAIDDARLLEAGDHHDPHVWFDLSLWAETPAVVAAALAALDPAHADEFHARADSYRGEMLEVHAQFRARLAKIPKERRVLITSHDAFRYFGRAYDLEVRGLQGISTDSDVGVKDVDDMAQLIVDRGIRAIFVESSVPRKAIEAVQSAVRSRGHEVRIGHELYSDAMGDLPPDDTYLGMVQTNVHRIVEALQ